MVSVKIKNICCFFFKLLDEKLRTGCHILFSDLSNKGGIGEGGSGEGAIGEGGIGQGGFDEGGIGEGGIGQS